MRLSILSLSLVVIFGITTNVSARSLATFESGGFRIETEAAIQRLDQNDDFDHFGRQVILDTNGTPGEIRANNIDTPGVITVSSDDTVNGSLIVSDLHLDPLNFDLSEYNTFRAVIDVDEDTNFELLLRSHDDESNEMEERVSASIDSSASFVDIDLGSFSEIDLTDIDNIEGTVGPLMPANIRLDEYQVLSLDEEPEGMTAVPTPSGAALGLIGLGLISLRRRR